MASLRRFPRSSYWYACFSLPDGRRVQRSTKQTQRKPAQALADQWETLAQERAGAKQAHRVIAEIYKSAHGSPLPGATAEDFFTKWIEDRRHEIKPATLTAYSARAKSFVAFLQTRASRPVADIQPDDVRKWRDEIRSRTTPSNANQSLKVLRVILEDAVRSNLIPENPAKPIKLLEKESASRRAFTIAELSAILRVADDEWRSLILCGFYTGQRLGDIARLTWANVDFEADEVRLRTAKTGRLVAIPICAPLRRHLLSLSSSDNAKAPLHSRAAEIAATTGKVSTLSRQFGELLAQAGLTAVRSHGSSGKGRSGSRESSEISFHSLRHTATSLLKNAGISPAVVQDIIGHESAEISSHYTHIESSAKRRAVDAMPDLVPDV